MAVEEVEEADVVVGRFDGGGGRRGEGECACFVLLEDVGCVGRGGGCGGWD